MIKTKKGAIFNFNTIIDILLVFGVVTGTIGSLVTAFKIPVNFPVIFIVFFISAVVFSIISTLYRKKALIILSFITIAFFILFFADIIQGMKSALNIISTEFNRWTFIPVLFEQSIPSNYEITAFFMLFAMILMIFLSHAVCIRFSTILTVLLTFPVLLLSFIILNNQPDIRFVFIVLGVYLILLISNMLDPGYTGQASGLIKRLKKDNNITGTVPGTVPGAVSETVPDKSKVFHALVITLVLLGITFFIAPQGSRGMTEFKGRINVSIRVLLSDLGLISYDLGYGWPQTPEDNWIFNTEFTQVSQSGTRNISEIALLEIAVSKPGTFYFRGFSMENFDGHTWSQDLSDDVDSYNDDIDVYEALSGRFPAQLIYIYDYINRKNDIEIVDAIVSHTGDLTSNIFYIPYFSNADPIISDNSYYLEFYYSPAISVFEIYEEVNKKINEGTIIGTNSIFESLDVYTQRLESTGMYRSVNDATSVALRQIAIDAGIDVNADREKITGQVVEFITNAAVYSLYPPRTPVNRDFAVDFLLVTKRGYCIHFATAAALMLRALDIPARFTTGYVVKVTDNNVNEIIVLTDRNAHAWVEVYFDNLGWIPYEVTPSSPVGGITTGHRVENLTVSEFIFNDFPDRDESIHYSEPEIIIEEPVMSDTEITDLPEIINERNSFWQFGVLTVVIIFTLILFSYKIISRIIRIKRVTQTDRNTAVINIDRYITRLVHFGKCFGIILTKPAVIRELSQRAYFSQHKITQEEYAKVLVSFIKIRAEIYDKSNVIFKFLVM